MKPTFTISLATPATVVYEIGGTPYQWSGVLNRYDGSGFDAQTRMVPCRINIDSPESATIYQPKFQGDQETSVYAPDLMTGMFVKVLIRADPPTPLVRLPQQAIQPGSVIWTVNDGKLKRQEISIATSTKDYVIAYQKAGGLAAGDRVVISPLATPVEGMAVIEAGSPEAEAAAKAAAQSSGWGGKASGWGGKGKASKRPGGKPAGKPNSREKASEK